MREKDKASQEPCLLGPGWLESLQLSPLHACRSKSLFQLAILWNEEITLERTHSNSPLLSLPALLFTSHLILTTLRRRMSLWLYLAEEETETLPRVGVSAELRTGSPPVRPVASPSRSRQRWWNM